VGSETPPAQTVTVGTRMTTDDVARIWQCTSETVRLLCESGKLRAFAVGSGKKRTNWRITMAAVEEYESQASNRSS
jgi:excisionase family DNA binding protein